MKYEIIVADNGSQDNSIQIASKFENVKVINVQRKDTELQLEQEFHKLMESIF